MSEDTTTPVSAPVAVSAPISAPESVNTQTPVNQIEPNVQGLQDNTIKPNANDSSPSLLDEVKNNAVTELDLKLPKDFQADEALLKDYKDFAKKTGLTNEQAQAVVDHYLQLEQNLGDKYKQTLEDNKQAAKVYLQQKWGPQFEANMTNARNAVMEFDKVLGGQLTTQLVNTGLANVPVVLELFSFLGDAISEKSLAGASAANDSGGLSMTDWIKSNVNNPAKNQIGV